MAAENPWLREAAYIDGAWVHGDRRFPVTDPARGSEIARVPDLGAGETVRAITAAERASAAWGRTTAQHRADLLWALYERMMAEKDALAELLTLEHGKPLAEAGREVAYGASFIRWFAEEARRIYGENIPASSPDKRIDVIQQPVGVCALITPWNFPNAMITRKLAPALAAGCTVVCKPAEQTPLSTLAVAALCEEVGIPAGVVNVITARQPEAVGVALCRSAAVRKLSFTGSTEVGRLLMAQCAPTLKRLSLELGGNAPFIVFADADLDAAVDGAMASKYRNNGQTCIASNRFLIHADVAEAFTERLVARSAELRVGHGLDPGTDLGPMIDQAGFDKVHRLVSAALDQGAEMRCGGIPGSGSGLFWPPTVLSGVRGDMALWGEEIFGPVAAIRTFSAEEEALSMANDTPHGLAAYVYTRDVGRTIRAREALDFGMVGVNTGLISAAQAPFGGIKQSGFGREGSRHGLAEYLQRKYICTGF